MHLLAQDGACTCSDPRQRREGQQGTKVSEARLITWHWHVYRSDSDNAKIVSPRYRYGMRYGRIVEDAGREEAGGTDGKSSKSSNGMGAGGKAGGKVVS